MFLLDSQHLLELERGVWYKTGSPFIGAGATTYLVTLDEPDEFSAFAVGDIVKLANHSVTPDLGATDLTVAEKITVNSATKQLRLTGFTTTSVINGTATGYITVRNTFLIAKGRIGVT